MAIRKRSSIRSSTESCRGTCSSVEDSANGSPTSSFSRKPKVAFKAEAKSTDLWADDRLPAGVAISAAANGADNALRAEVGAATSPAKLQRTGTMQKLKPFKKEVDRELQQKKAAVAQAASVYGLDGMKANMQARIEHDREHAQARMDRIEAKVDGLSSSMQRMEKLLLGLAGSPVEEPLNNPLIA